MINKYRKSSWKMDYYGCCSTMNKSKKNRLRRALKKKVKNLINKDFKN